MEISSVQIKKKKNAPLSLHSHFEMTSSTISQYTATASVQRKQTSSSDSSTTSSKHRIRSKSEISYCRKRSIVAEKNVLAKSGQQISVLERLPTLYRDALLPLNVNEAKDQFIKQNILPTFEFKVTEKRLKTLLNRNSIVKYDLYEEAKYVLEQVRQRYDTAEKYYQAAYGPQISTDTAKTLLEQYLMERKLYTNVTVTFAPGMVCSGRMIAYTKKNSNSNFAGKDRKFVMWVNNVKENIFLRRTGIICLANHEIETHYLRSFNEGLQPWFKDRAQFGLKDPNCRQILTTEEGLASLHTLIEAHQQYLFSSALSYYIICLANKLSFGELFIHLERYVKDPNQRWKHLVRIKQGFKDPNQIGAVGILRNLATIDFRVLMSGKVSLQDLKRIQRIAHLNVIRLPSFMKDLDQYKKRLQKIAQLNGLLNQSLQKNITDIKKLIDVDISNERTRQSATCTML
ncbi:unnamed protein product [Didymodactylos carnosus]|uniref:Uncharacterized protein n=1 Tax=Didymodactylos carnosus TaxID=1234261 RepID=A0A815KC01_9BILA|nr:unnamed protein product [Didymodactylos carnosus]CAF4285741.1 unnamed protein product [Didymodactylos carnosus]